MSLCFLFLAVGFGVNHHNELALDVYRQSVVVVDSLAAGERELKGLIDTGVPLHCELGEKIRGVRSLPDTARYTVFHSLGKPKLNFFKSSAKKLILIVFMTSVNNFFLG